MIGFYPLLWRKFFLHDFHTHTFLSDGVLSPLELIRRAVVRGYRTIAITDHVGFGNQEQILGILVEDCLKASQQWNITALPGVELTHIPPKLIDKAAVQAKELGAIIVALHGETLVEPVEPGTNMAGVKSTNIDILAHPGLLTLEEGQLAKENNVFLELSARKGHCLSNGHVVKIAQQTGAELLLNSDTHEPGDLLDPDIARIIATASGLEERDVSRVLNKNPVKLLSGTKS